MTIKLSSAIISFPTTYRTVSAIRGPKRTDYTLLPFIIAGLISSRTLRPRVQHLSVHPLSLDTCIRGYNDAMK